MTDRYIAFANSPVGRRLVAPSAFPPRCAWSAGRPAGCARWTARW